MKKPNKLPKKAGAKKAKKKVKFPYDYHSVALTSVPNGAATFTGKPTKEDIEAVNAMAALAFKTIKKKPK